MLVYQRITLKNATLCKWYFLQSTHRQPGIPPFPNSKWWLPWWRTSLKMSEWCGITEIGQWEHLLYSEQETPINLMAKKNMVSGENFPNKTNPLNPSTLVRYDITCFDLGFRNVQDILRKSRLAFAVHNHKPSSRIVNVVGGKYSSHLQWSTQPLWLSSWTMRA